MPAEAKKTGTDTGTHLEDDSALMGDVAQRLGISATAGAAMDVDDKDQDGEGDGADSGQDGEDDGAGTAEAEEADGEEGQDGEGDGADSGQDDDDKGAGTAEGEEADGEGEEDLDADPVIAGLRLPPATQQKITKRIGTYARRAKTAEEQLGVERERLATLQGELATLRSGSASPDEAASRILDASAVDELDRIERDLIRQRRLWASRREGYTSTDETKEPSRTAEEVAQILDTVEEGLLVHLPRARRDIGSRAQAEQYTRTAYPKLYAANTPEHAMVEEILRRVPGIRRLANWRLVIGDALRGERDRLARAQAKAAAGRGAQNRATRVPTAGAGASARNPISSGAKRDGVSPSAFKSFQETGGSRDALVRCAVGLIPAGPTGARK